MLQVYNINQISMSVQWPTNTRTSKYVAAYYFKKKKDHTGQGELVMRFSLIPSLLRMINLDNLL